MRQQRWSFEGAGTRIPRTVDAPRAPSSHVAIRTSTWSVSRALSAVNETISDITESARASDAVETATKQLQEATAYERSAISEAVRKARRQIDFEDYFSDPWSLPDRGLDLEEALNPTRWESYRSKTAISVDAVDLPPRHQDAALDEAIRDRCRFLMEQRTRHLEEVRQRIASDPRLSTLVRAELTKMGTPVFWDLVTVR